MNNFKFFIRNSLIEKAIIRFPDKVIEIDVKSWSYDSFHDQYLIEDFNGLIYRVFSTYITFIGKRK